MRRLLSILLVFASLALAEPPKRTSLPRKTSLHVPVWSETAEPLDSKEFRCLLNGKESPVRKVRGAGDDMVILLAIDLTEDLTHVESARRAVAGAVDSLPRNVWCAVLKAHDNLEVLVDPTPDRAAAVQAISGLTTTGRAGMLTTVEIATAVGDAMIEKSGVRIALLYITDSNAYNYREDFSNPVINSTDYRDLSRRFSEGLIREKILKVAGGLAARETPLFFVHLNYRSDPVNEAYQAGLMQMAASTGGTGVFSRSIGEIPEAINKVMGTIVRHSILEVDLPPRGANGWQIQVENSGRTLMFRPRFALKGSR